MVKRKIACYITGGWTECGYMTRFLEKINRNYDYRQRFPQKNIGKKGKERTKITIDGTTGSALIKWIYSDLRRHGKELTDYSAIIIEDDLDDNYFLESGTKRDYELIEKRKQEIKSEIRGLLQKPDLPVIFFYALPEIEAWFLADWDQSFAIEYKSVLKEMNSYFSITMKKYVNKEILTDKFSISEIENFGFVNGKYTKISEKFRTAFIGYSQWSEADKNNQIFNERINKLIKDNKIAYSKKMEGVNMLLRIRPEVIAVNCRYYFINAFNELKDLMV